MRRIDCTVLRNCGHYKEDTFNDLVDIPMNRRLSPALKVSVMSGKEFNKRIASMFFILRTGLGSTLTLLQEDILEEVKSGIEASDLMDENVLQKALRSNNLIQKKMDKQKFKKELRAIVRDKNRRENVEQSLSDKTESIQKSITARPTCWCF